YDEAADQPHYVDANPRIGETVNAILSGTNLCDLLMQVSLGHMPPRPPPSRSGVRTHSLLTSLLAAAERGAGRLRLLSEVARACTSRGLYEQSSEETNCIADDWPSAVPLAVVLSLLLVAPAKAKGIVEGTVNNYALNAAAANR